MERIRFGTTDLFVSDVGFGCARLGGFFQSADKGDMVRTLREALAAGVTFYDTSDMYTQGESEQVLGEAFHGVRDQVVIASKFGYCLPAQRQLLSRVKPLVKPLVQKLGIRREHLPSAIRGSLAQNFSPSYVVHAVEQSLRRLKTDHLDLCQLHSPPAEVLAQGDFLAPLQLLQRQGKIRYYGVSCERTSDAQLCLRLAGISSLQLRMSLLDQSALPAAVEQAAAQGVAVIARECFAGGLLAKPAEALDLDALLPDEAGREAKRQEISALRAVAERSGRSLPELALQFIRSAEGVSVTLVGMRTSAHLADTLRLRAAAPLSDGERQAIAALHQSALPQ
jgi:aryl-alcohol dehydrogenase-like predicted oxidoreductase